MSVRILLLTGAFLLTACARSNLALQDPVGQTTARAMPPPPADTASAAAAPCGADPPMIEFAESSSDITEPQQKELQSFVSCLSATPNEAAGVVLVGYTDVMGTTAANLELGLARAQVVMRQLINGGVAPGRIVVASAGELQRPQARWGMHAHRVEILLSQGGPARPNEAPIARGIDAEGLVPRQRQPAKPSSAAATPTPGAVGRSPGPSNVPRPVPRGR